MSGTKCNRKLSRWPASIRNLIIVLAIGGLAVPALAQEPEQEPAPPLYPSHLRANVGFSTIGLFANLANHVGVVANIEVFNPPALQLAYTYRLYNRVSLGVGLSRQVFSIRYRNYEYEEGGRTLLDNFTTYIRRFNVGALALVHYNRGSKLELYSGVRLGITRWTFDTSAQDINYTIGRFLSFALGTQPSLQLILIGGNTYFTPHLGANFELGIGAPHLFSAGVGYRW